MQPARLALALLTLGCSGGGDQNTGFASHDGTTAGPSSFGDSTTGAPTSSDATASTSTTSTTGETTTSSTSSAAVDDTTTASTTEPTPTCGDGLLDDGELCDDGNHNDGDACLADCTPGHALLALVGRGDASAAIATYTHAAGWTLADAAYDVTAAQLAQTPTGALAVVRRAGAVPEQKDELWSATWTASTPEQFATANVVGAFGFTLDTPAIASAGDAVTLTFLGTDNKHYTSVHTGATWAPFTALPASALDIQAFGPSAATLAAGPLATHAVYAGDDDKVYVAHKPAPGAAWQASIQAPAPAVRDTIRPAAAVLASGDLVLAYVRSSDQRIGVTRRSLADNTWTLETLVHADARASALTLQRTDGDALVLAWRDIDDPGQWLATAATPDTWAPPINVETPSSSSPPVLTAGALGADAELLYAAAGKLRHARVLAGELTPPVDVADLTAAASVAATRVQLAP